MKNALATGTFLSIPSFFQELQAKGSEEMNFLKSDPLGYARSTGFSDPSDLAMIAGITAPNSHNSQPWKLKKISTEKFALYGDFDRQLLPIDPKNRQFFHTQGCFLELAEEAALELGFKPKITIFPSGIPNEKTGKEKPMAIFEMTKDLNAKPNPLFSFVKWRQMNRTAYEGAWITNEETEQIETLCLMKNAKLVFVTDPDKIQSVSKVLVESFGTEIQDKEKNEISRQYFRITEKDIYEKADGLTLEAAGLSNPMLWLAKKFFLDLSYEGFHSTSALKQSLEIIEKGANSAKAYVFLVTTGKDDEKTWIETGKDFVRLCLALAGKGISFHTMNQAFVDYPESLLYQEKVKQIIGLGKGQVIQLGGRMGRSEYRFASARRDLAAFKI